MEIKYRETLTDRRRAAATLELKLEKERQRVKGYKQAMVSQSHQLMEERKQLHEVTSCLAVYFHYCAISFWTCIKKKMSSFLQGA